MVMTDKEARFRRIIHENRDTIYAVCYMFSKDADEVDDLFQDVLINLWKGLDSFGGRSSVRTWIYRIALNTCISGRRKRKQQHSVPLTMDINLFEDGDDDTLQVKMLYERINSLGLYDRALILLWLDNMSYEEIGAVMGISEKNVSVRLVRIKEKLKNINDK